MTSRERIRAAIAHREPDRVPIDCGAMRSTGIQAIAYHRLREHLGRSGGPVKVFDVIQQLAEPEPWYLDHFGIDAINAGRDFPQEKWQDWTLPDGTPCKIPAAMDFRQEEDEWRAYAADGGLSARMIPGATYFSQACWPMAGDDWAGQLPELPRHMGKICWANLAEPLYADGLSDANLRRIGEHVARLRQRSDRATMIAFGGNLFEWGTFLRRMDNFLMDLAADPVGTEALLDKLVEIHLANLDKLLPVLGDNVDLIQLGDDLGTENGPFFSPKMYRQYFKPRHTAIVRHIKKLQPNLTVFLHTCGSVADLLPDLIEAGFEVINPVQISARHMEPERLKRDFGKDVTFWGGGCDTQAVLSRGTPQQVRDHVRRNIEVFAPGGGFVFNQVHNILAEVPPANVVAMYEAARQP